MPVDQSMLPAEGWRCLRITDLGMAVGDCDRCGKEKIRFVHHLEHPQYPSILAVGCVCAGEMLGDPEAVRRRERKMAGRAARRERFLKRRWEVMADRSVHLRVREHDLMLFQVVGGGEHNRWVFTIDGEMSPQTYATVGEAKAAVFEMLYPE